MRELAYLGRRRVEWRSVAEPALQGEREALVRPVITARCAPASHCITSIG
jgi:hypothetical protein